jgi:hypothetical protein
VIAARDGCGVRAPRRRSDAASRALADAREICLDCRLPCTGTGSGRSKTSGLQNSIVAGGLAMLPAPAAAAADTLAVHAAQSRAPRVVDAPASRFFQRTPPLPAAAAASASASSSAPGDGNVMVMPSPPSQPHQQPSSATRIRNMFARAPALAPASKSDDSSAAFDGDFGAAANATELLSAQARTRVSLRWNALF